MSANNDYTERLRRLQAKTLAHYHSANPTMKEQGALPRCFDSSSYTVRKLGEMSFTLKPGGGFAINDPCCDVSGTTPTPCVPTGEVLNILLPETSTGPFDPPYDAYNSLLTVTWDAVTNATSYTVTFSDTVNSLVVYTGGTTASIYSIDGYPYEETVTITAYNSCSESSGFGNTFCFLAGSPVTLADGSVKAIEDVKYGDLVLGAFGEINTVLGLHISVLGDKQMLNINNEHHTTSHHPHVGADKQFYCMDTHLLYRNKEVYGREIPIIGENNIPTKIFLHGLREGRIKDLEVGTELKTVEGSRVVTSLETYLLPPETKLYTLAVSGSHTFYVNGYAVGGFTREDDFDYDSWK
jgi:hypothetical protein